MSGTELGGVVGELPAAVAESEARRAWRERAHALGLSSVHISSEQPPGTVRVHAGGALVRLRGDKVPSRRTSAVRGLVHGFSRASRRRMMRFLQSLDQEAVGLPLFVTLTYPGEWPGNPRRWKRDLDVWLGRLRRAHPEAWAVWRLEPQRRGAPHYHLLVFGLPRLEAAWLSRSWFEVVGSGDERHLRAGTQVQRVESWRRVIRYASKYLAKEVEELPDAWQHGVGRWWGVHNRKQAHRDAYEVELGSRGFYRLRRVVRRMVFGPGASGRFWSERSGLPAGDVLRKGIEGFVSASALLRLVEWCRLDA